MTATGYSGNGLEIPTCPHGVHGADGYDAETIFQERAQQGVAYDDVILMPGYIDFGVDQVDMTTNFTRNIKISVPLASAPMDTVTEAEMAIAMASVGGIGVIHCNCEVDDQCEMVSQTKNFRNGFIMEPITMGPTATVQMVMELKEEKGFSTVPITQNGFMGGKLLGVVTGRDIDMLEDTKVCVTEVMTPFDKLTVGYEPITLTDAQEKLCENKLGTLPIVNKAGELVALTSRTDLKKTKTFPNASMDKNQQLLVAAAVPVGDTARIDDLVMAGVDAILIHSLHGDTKDMVDTVKYIKANHKNTDVIAGNIVTSAQARNLCEAGADAIRIGMGASSVSMTASVSAVGRPQATAVYNVAKFVQKEFGIPVLADGGCNNSGQVMKALCLGANAVFCGSLLAGSDQAPGSYFYNEGMRVKAFRGTASTMQQARTGVSGAVVDKGDVLKLVQYIMMGVRHGMQDLGVKTMEDLHPSLRSGKVRMEIRSNCAQKEGKVHDLHRSGKGNAFAFKASLGMS